MQGTIFHHKHNVQKFLISRTFYNGYFDLCNYAACAHKGIPPEADHLMVETFRRYIIGLNQYAYIKYV